MSSIKKEKKEIVRDFQAPRGMHDVLPAEQPYWEKVESVARDLARLYNFHRIEPPILESVDVFKKTMGEESEVVEKEMYTLKTKGGDFLALRPEYTASNARAYLEHSLSRMGQPQKLFNFGPVFRHDRPQLGRFRQFTQIGFEFIGGLNDAIYDAQIILVFTKLLEELKINNTTLSINSIGCRVCRPNYKKQIKGFYEAHAKELCEDCLRHLKSNSLRLLDCKKPECSKLKHKAPNLLDKLCMTCSTHFREVLEYLDELEIAYALDHQLVRGLDYYSRTVFEIFAEDPGSELGAIAAGGRYDYLMEILGGHLTPAVGGAAGVERLIALMRIREIEAKPSVTKRVFLAHAGDSAKKNALRLMRDLMNQGIPVSEALARESLHAQLKVADKEGVRFALILGQKEMYESSVIIRDMRTGLQETVKLDRVVDEIKKRSRI